jgi:hypothetical protein
VCNASSNLQAAPQHHTLLKLQSHFLFSFHACAALKQPPDVVKTFSGHLACADMTLHDGACYTRRSDCMMVHATQEEENEGCPCTWAAQLVHRSFGSALLYEFTLMAKQLSEELEYRGDKKIRGCKNDLQDAKHPYRFAVLAAIWGTGANSTFCLHMTCS